MAHSEQFVIDHKIHAEVIANFRRRAARLSLYSFVVIALIVLVLASGISIFIYAGQIANSESNSALQERRSHLIDTEAELKRTSDVLEQQRAELTRLRSMYEQEVLGKEGTGIAGHGPRAEYITREVRRAEERLDNYEAVMHQVSNVRDTLRAEIVKAEEEAKQSGGISQSQIPVLVSAFATRVGSVVLLLFLVQILVPLYRYNMKLSSYYDARADALTIVNTHHPEGLAGDNGADGANATAPVRTSIDMLERLVAALSPDYIDFGKAPATPSEHALKFAKDVITARRK